MNVSNDATEQGLSGTLTFFNPLGTAGWKKVTAQTTYWYSGTPEIIGTTIAAAYKSATAVNAVQFKPNGGVNFTVWDDSSLRHRESVGYSDGSKWDTQTDCWTGPTLAASATNIYTPPAAVATIYTNIKQIHIANVTSGAVTFTLYIGATGGSAERNGTGERLFHCGE